MSVTSEAVIAIAESQQQQVVALIEVLQQTIAVLKATNDATDKLIAIIKAKNA